MGDLLVEMRTKGGTRLSKKGELGWEMLVKREWKLIKNV